MKTRIVLFADKGKILTDGKAYGKIIYLAEGVEAESFYEITEEEYKEMLKIQEEKPE